MLTPSRSPLIAAAAAALAAMLSSAQTASAQLTVNLLHNNDGESAVLPFFRDLDGDPNNGAEAGPLGGAAYFGGVVSRQRGLLGTNTLTLSSGDNFLAGPAFTASLASGTFYDARVINRVGYNALTLGNHDFDFGPDVLADFIDQVDPNITFLSANLDFANEPRLQALVNDGRIARSKVITLAGGERLGVIGATTEDLRLISSPRNVIINDVISSVQSEIDFLAAQGVNKIVLSSHLQGINNEVNNVVPNLTGVDVVIAGGGDELLANDPAHLLPGDGPIQGPYPIQAIRGGDGRIVPVVTTAGEYKYLGQLSVDFDAAGDVTGFNGRPFRVLGDTDFADAVQPDQIIQDTVVTPVQQFVAGLDANVLARTDVALEGRTGKVRTRETNFGNLIADAILDTAQELSSTFGVDAPVIGLQNGGGIRNNLQFAAGDDVTELDTFNALPFPNFVSVIEDVPVETVLSVLERAVSAINLGPDGQPIEAGAQGRFAQISGFSFEYDATQTAQTVDPQTGEVLVEGQRVVRVILDGPNGGTVIVEDGEVVSTFEGLLIDVATIDFLARGGDGYPIFDPVTGERLVFTTLGVTYQQALADFIAADLNGVIPASLYPEGGEGRIMLIPEPGAAGALAGLGGLMTLRRRRGATCATAA